VPASGFGSDTAPSSYTQQVPWAAYGDELGYLGVVREEQDENYPELDRDGFAGIEANLADCWQDILATENHFDNFSFMRGMPG
jgi:hypothetical protein